MVRALTYGYVLVMSWVDIKRDVKSNEFASNFQIRRQIATRSSVSRAEFEGEACLGDSLQHDQREQFHVSHVVRVGRHLQEIDGMVFAGHDR
jgi:hypothetical protein